VVPVVVDGRCIGRKDGGSVMFDAQAGVIVFGSLLVILIVSAVFGS